MMGHFDRPTAGQGPSRRSRLPGPRPAEFACQVRSAALAVPEAAASLAEPHVSGTTELNRAVEDLVSPLLTAHDVAALLAVPRSSVYEYARRTINPLPSLMIGRHRRLDRRDICRWLAEQRASER